MPKDYTEFAATKMRRSDRAVDDDAWMKQFLHHATVGILATVHGEQPFINTNLFVYDEAAHCVYIHTANSGRTYSNVAQQERVCFSIMTMGRLLPDAVALEFSVEYGGVTIFGDAIIVDDNDEATRALQMLLDKYAPHLEAGKDYRPPILEELKRTAVYRISIDEWTGKKKEVEAHEGAYWFDELPILRSVQERTLWRGQLRGIYIASDEAAPVQAVPEIEAVVDKGLRGDRYFDGKGAFSHLEGQGRAVTLIAQEDIEAAAAESDFDLTPEMMRRNLLTVGAPLNHLVGKRFRIGEVVLEGIRLCEPCNTLGKYTGHGKALITATLHRAGLRADIVKGGMIRAGDSIVPLD